MKGRTEHPTAGVSSFFHLKSGLFWPTLKAPTRVRGGDGSEQAIDRLGFSRAGSALRSRSERSVQVPRRERASDLHQCQTRHGGQELHLGELGSVRCPGSGPHARRAIFSRIGPCLGAQRKPPQDSRVGASERAATTLRCPAEARRAGRNSRRRRAELRSGAGAIEAIPGSGRPAHKEHRAASRRARPPQVRDRKSTRLNSSHLVISYAVFCLKKKKKKI